MFVDTDLKPSRNMTVAVMDGDYEFPSLNDGQLKSLYRFSLALTFCSIVKNTQGAAWSSDHFPLFRQDFSIGQNRIRYQTGSYVRHTQLGLPIGEGMFVKPGYITNNDRFIFDRKLLRAFNRAIEVNNPDDDAFFTALKWISDAHINVDGFSAEIRPVILATAFETFFGLPRSDKGNELADRIETLLDVDQMFDMPSKQTGLPRIYPVKSRKKSWNFTIYGKWVKEFYGGLRSTIVHTGTASPTDWVNHNGKSHFEIALRVMNFCFYRLLESKGYLIYEPTEFQGINTDKFLTETGLRTDIEDSIR